MIYQPTRKLLIHLANRTLNKFYVKKIIPKINSSIIPEESKRMDEIDDYNIKSVSNFNKESPAFKKLATFNHRVMKSGMKIQKRNKVHTQSFDQEASHRDNKFRQTLTNISTIIHKTEESSIKDLKTSNQYWSPNMSSNCRSKERELSKKRSIYYNLERIKYSINKEKSQFNVSHSGSISKFDDSSYDDARRRTNNHLSYLINNSLGDQIREKINKEFLLILNQNRKSNIKLPNI